jgi:hypothetical protein
MADINLDVESPPLTPAAGTAIAYFDSITKILSQKDDGGFIRSLGPSNFSTVSQAPVAATRTYIAGSALTIPGGKLQIGSCFRWRFSLTKTAAGLAASTIDVAVGTTGTTTDTARVSFTKPAGTAVVDEGWAEIYVICRGPLSASGVFAGEFILSHNGNTVGHAIIPVVVVNTISGTFDVTVAGLVVGVCITTGASDAITIQLVQAEAWNL